MKTPYVLDGIKNLRRITGRGLGYAVKASPFYYTGEIMGFKYANTPAPVAQFIVDHIPEKLPYYLNITYDDVVYVLFALSVISIPFVLTNEISKFRGRKGRS